MDWLVYVGIGVVNFAYIFLKAFQQRNVAYSNYLSLYPTGLLLALCEAWVIDTIAAQGVILPLILALWLGGATGAHCSIILHKRIHRGSDEES